MKFLVNLAKENNIIVDKRFIDNNNLENLINYDKNISFI